MIVRFAVTVQSSGRPVRVVQPVLHVERDLRGRARHPRAEDRASSRSRLFGYELARHEELFDEKATLFAELLKGGPVPGKARPARPLNQDVWCRTQSPGRSRRGSV